jgi:hypothetical protein
MGPASWRAGRARNSAAASRLISPSAARSGLTTQTSTAVALSIAGTLTMLPRTVISNRTSPGGGKSGAPIAREIGVRVRFNTIRKNALDLNSYNSKIFQISGEAPQRRHQGQNRRLLQLPRGAATQSKRLDSPILRRKAARKIAVVAFQQTLAFLNSFGQDCLAI